MISTADSQTITRLFQRQGEFIKAVAKLQDLLPNLIVDIVREAIPTMPVEYYDRIEIRQKGFLFGGKVIANVHLKDKGTFSVEFLDPIKEISDAVTSLAT